MEHTSPQGNDDTPGRNRWQNLPKMSLACGIIGLQSGLLAAFVTHRIGMPCYLGIHLGLSAMIVIIGLWARSQFKTGNNTTFFVQLAILTALGGPFGTAIAAMLLVPQKIRADSASPATAVESVEAGDTGLTRWELLHNAMLDGRLRLEGANLVRPLLDVMLDGTRNEKLEALSLISKRYEATLEPALRQAIADKDAAVRVLAATVIAEHAPAAPIEAERSFPTAAASRHSTSAKEHPPARASDNSRDNAAATEPSVSGAAVDTAAAEILANPIGPA